MFKEYAVEPDVFLTWGSDEWYYLVLHGFGIGTSRYITDIPSRKWKEEIIHGRESLTPLQSSRIIALLQNKFLTRQTATWDERLGWLDNVSKNDQVEHFSCIVSRDKVLLERCVIPDLREELAKNESNFSVPRTAQDMSKAVEMLLRFSHTIVFYDSYLNFQRKEYQQSFEGYMKSVLKYNNECKINIISSIYNRKESYDKFKDATFKFLNRFKKPNLSINAYLYGNTESTLSNSHNRYIITDIGGVIFPNGLDAKAGTEDELTIMSKPVFNKKFYEFSQLVDKVQAVLAFKI